MAYDESAIREKVNLLMAERQLLGKWAPEGAVNTLFNIKRKLHTQELPIPYEHGLLDGLLESGVLDEIVETIFSPAELEILRCYRGVR